MGAIQHHFDDGERWARLADAILERDPGRSPRLRGWFLHNRGTLHAARGRWRLAEGDFTAAVALRQQGTASAQPELATSMVHLARAVLTLDEPQRAIAMAERALAVAGAIFPADSFEVATARLIRGRALVALDRAAEARADLEAVMEVFERLLGRDHPFLAEPMTGLGEVALAERRPVDAQGLLERAWEMRSTHTADGGAREETAFHLARAIWEASPTDRRRALELAAEARDGYAAMPELAPRLAAVDRWLAGRHAARTRPAGRRGACDAQPFGASSSSTIRLTAPGSTLPLCAFMISPTTRPDCFASDTPSFAIVSRTIAVTSSSDAALGRNCAQKSISKSSCAIASAPRSPIAAYSSRDFRSCFWYAAITSSHKLSSSGPLNPAAVRRSMCLVLIIRMQSAVRASLARIASFNRCTEICFD